MEPGLQLDHVTVGYHSSRRWPFAGDDLVIVSKIDALAEVGTLTSLLGPNGAGKSTLLRSLLGLQPVLDGSVRLSGTELSAISARERAQRTAVVLTDRVDAGLLTGREVTELGRHPHRSFAGRMTDEDLAIVEQSLTQLHAESLANKRFAELSDGQRQRILLARALAQQPELLILDEPSAFLDVGARVDLMALLQQIAADRQISIVVSTHEVELALRMSHWIWLIHQGSLISGTPDEVINSGAISAVFETPTAHFDPESRTFDLRP